MGQAHTVQLGLEMILDEQVKATVHLPGDSNIAD